MIEVEFIKNFFIALALGALVGLEREYARYRKRGHSYAGIRTYPLIAIFGFLSAHLGTLISMWILIAGIVLVGLLIIAAFFALVEKSRQYIGATSEVAGFLTFFIGVLSYFGEIKLAAVVAIIMTIVLYARSLLHNFAKKIQKHELADTLKFAVIAFVILPFLPNKGYGPMEVFNPYTAWLVVVLISGISFAGYIFMKWFGEKGIALAGILGGIASSTAVTTSFAHRSKVERQNYRALAMGVVFANGMMFIRVLFLVFILNKTLFFQLLLPVLLLSLLAFLMGYLIWRESKLIKGKIKLSSPFTLSPALKFALIFIATTALVKYANSYFAAEGIYTVSVLSGLVDMDAITVSLSRLDELPLLNIAKNGIIAAALTNIAVKGGIAFWFGDRKFGKIVAGIFSLLIVMGIVLLLFL